MRRSEKMEDQYREALVEDSLGILTAFLNRAHLFLIKLWTPFNRIAL